MRQMSARRSDRRALIAQYKQEVVNDLRPKTPLTGNERKQIEKLTH